MQCIKCVFPVFSKKLQRIRSNRRAGFPRRVKEVGALDCPLTPSSAETENECNYTPRTSAWNGLGTYFCRLVRTVTKIAYYHSHVRPCVCYCPSVLHVSAWLPAGRISVKFDIGDFH